MRNFNAKAVFCLLAAMVMGGTMFAQRPTMLRGTQASTIEDAIPGNYSVARQGIHVLGPILNVSGPTGNCDTVLFEDFQSQTIPATWENIDVDGNTDANGRAQDWFITADLETTTGTDTNWVAAASSWFTPLAQASNWLIMDQVTICDSALVMQWQSAPFEGPGFADGYKVFASPTGDSTIASFTDTLAVLAEDVGGGAGTPGPGWVHSTYNGTRGVLETWVVPLAAYNNATIRIGFHHDSDDDNLILLDNIFIGLPQGGDMAQISRGFGEYPVVPVNQIQAMTFSGRIGNNGATALSNATLNVEVFDGSAGSVYTGDVSVASLPAFTDTSVSVGTYTPPAAADNYGIAYWATSNTPDPNTANDTLEAFFSIDDTTYARDNGNVTGALSIGGTAAGFIGQEFDMIATDTLTSAGFWLSNPTLGDTIHAVVIPIAAAGMPPAGAPIATSADLIITDTTGQYYEVPFVGGVELNAGTTYFLGLEETVAGALTLGTSNEVFTPTKGWVFFNGSWSNSEDFNFNVAYVLRAVFGTTTLVGVEDQLRDDISIYPVPANDYINVAVASGHHSDLNVQVSDLQGRALINQVIPSSSNIAKIHVGELSSGIYFVEVRGAEGRFVQRISVR